MPWKLFQLLEIQTLSPDKKLLSEMVSQFLFTLKNHTKT